MKKITLILFIAMIGLYAHAQEASVSTEKKTRKGKTIVRPDHCQGIYIATSTGINNNTAMVGFSFEVPVTKTVSIEAGPGTGTWGDKIFAGVKYYPKPCQRGFAFGAGFGYFPGVRPRTFDLETVSGTTQPVTYQMNHRTCISFTIHKYWTIGKKYNRIYVETGWSTLLSHSDKITQLSYPRMSTKEMNRLNSGITPGPILAAGVSFGLH